MPFQCYLTHKYIILLSYSFLPLMKNSKLNFILFSGVWFYPISFCMIWFVFSAFHSALHDAKDITINTFFVIAGAALIPVAGILLYNVYLLLTKRKTDFSFPGYFHKNDISRKKLKALYPAIDSRYLSQVPEGLILGKYKSLYVRIPHDP